MRSILMIVIILAISGCNNDDGGGGSSNSTTPALKESSIIAPPSEELKAKGYNDEYERVNPVLVIPGTAIAGSKQERELASYRKQWKRVNDDPTNGYRLVDGHYEVDLDNLSFRKAFELQYRAHGEGHTFWWRNNQYTTNLLED